MQWIPRVCEFGRNERIHCIQGYHCILRHFFPLRLEGQTLPPQHAESEFVNRVRWRWQDREILRQQRRVGALRASCAENLRNLQEAPVRVLFRRLLTVYNSPREERKRKVEAERLRERVE